MDNNKYGKTKEESISDLRHIIASVIGKEALTNATITDIRGNRYTVIYGTLSCEGIEINKDMVTGEVPHDIIVPYYEIKEIEDRISNTVLYSVMD